ncbi:MULTISPECIES: hypothetical protein [unclassified Methylibium]|uniref:hypothetical protein n=1 Tax=unclassified Methylibium TaxID=2633235 RepID=UPI0003F40206|nr:MULTISPECIES: hypothetical protein [unclassified Methylibium]EWS54793.1 hypothetical protein X551_02393 [Methylibium sp. T29]EWS59094.1 hypothetical protein Y694_03071 [Methylibium sp. T29-B]
MAEIKVKKDDDKRFSWSHEEWKLSVDFKTSDEFEDWLNKETKYFIRANAGFYAQCVIVCVESKGDEFLCYVDYYKGKYPPWYSAEELAVLDIDELRKEPAKVKWEDWEWTTLKQDDFPLRLKEVIFLYPPQEPVMPWLFLSPEESGLAKMDI